MPDNTAVQSLLGMSAARLHATRGSLLDCLHQIVAAFENDGTLTGGNETTLRMCTMFAIQEAGAALNICYHEVGASAIRHANSFECRFRDIRAVSQQIQGRRGNFELVGMRSHGLESGPIAA